MNNFQRWSAHIIFAACCFFSGCSLQWSEVVTKTGSDGLKASMLEELVAFKFPPTTKFEICSLRGGKDVAFFCRLSMDQITAESFENRISSQYRLRPEMKVHLSLGDEKVDWYKHDEDLIKSCFKIDDGVFLYFCDSLEENSDVSIFFTKSGDLPVSFLREVRRAGT